MNPKGALLLNVDDYADGRYGKTRVLQEAGFEVIEAGTGAQALEAVRSRRPQLELLDVQLPDIDGFEVCRRIRSDPGTQHIPVLHISATYDQAHGGADRRERGRCAGGRVLIVKANDAQRCLYRRLLEPHDAVAYEVKMTGLQLRRGLRMALSAVLRTCRGCTRSSSCNSRAARNLRRSRNGVFRRSTVAVAMQDRDRRAARAYRARTYRRLCRWISRTARRVCIPNRRRTLRRCGAVRGGRPWPLQRNTSSRLSASWRGAGSKP